MSTKLWIIRQTWNDKGVEHTDFTCCDTLKEALGYWEDIKDEPHVSLEVRSIIWNQCQRETFQ